VAGAVREHARRIRNACPTHGGAAHLRCALPEEETEARRRRLLSSGQWSANGKKKAYSAEPIDMLVTYIVAEDVPDAGFAPRRDLRFDRSGSGRGLYEKYREAWHLMNAEALTGPRPLASEENVAVSVSSCHPEEVRPFAARRVPDERPMHLVAIAALNYRGPAHACSR
jgi:hypothetical protein